MASEVSNRLVPGRSLGPFLLGTHLHDVLRRLKSPQLATQYPRINLSYSQSDPVSSPIIITLSRNGIRLRFDGPGQQLRLIEVLDFHKTRIEYEGIEIFKSHESAQSGPSYRSLSKVFGPTFPGECTADEQGGPAATYVLSYPGVAFCFSVSRAALESRKDNQALLSSSAASCAKAMAIFAGESWPKARAPLFSSLSNSQGSERARPRATSTSRQQDGDDDVELVKVHGQGRLELVRRSGQSLSIALGETTPQDLVSELGPPDAIYRKNDRRLTIHRNRGLGRDRSSSADTDYSSSRTTEDDSDDEDEADVALSAEARELASAEHFYNYNRFGFDLLISQATKPSEASPTLPEAMTDAGSGQASGVSVGGQTATKMIMHGNIPASWLFSRHRRCRWTLEHVPTARDRKPLNSEMDFTEISSRLGDVFGNSEISGSNAGQPKGMQLNRGWNNSPSSSCELLGGWEEDGSGAQTRGELSTHSQREQGVSGNSELVGYPGMIFEVLPNGAVCGLTVY